MDASLVARLYQQAQASRWGVSERTFTAALERSAAKALPDRPQDRQRLERYLTSLHLEDLALACACAEGHDAAWDHFVREYRPILYRSADAIDPAGGARELADSIYADLFGLHERDGERRSLLRYFHGRSSLSTWLRAVLAQRQVDRIRSTRRLTPLDSAGTEESPLPALVSAPAADPDTQKVRCPHQAGSRTCAGASAGPRPPQARLLLPRGPDTGTNRSVAGRTRSNGVAPAGAFTQGHPGGGRTAFAREMQFDRRRNRAMLRVYD